MKGAECSQKKQKMNKEKNVTGKETEQMQEEEILRAQLARLRKQECKTQKASSVPSHNQGQNILTHLSVRSQG